MFRVVNSACLASLAEVNLALHALEGHAHERLPGRRHAVEHGGHAELLVVGAALGVRERVAVERGRDAVVVGRARQHVAREHAQRELVVRHVGVERVDQPVAPRPDVAVVVLLVALRVGVAAEVEPDPRETLAIRGAREQRIDSLGTTLGDNNVSTCNILKRQSISFEDEMIV